jgi:3-dehydroquinate synthase
MLSIVDAMDSFGVVRTEPTLVIGGGLVTDVSGYACASYRRTSNFIRVPTTLIGLIDASVSIKVGINHRKLKNRWVRYGLDGWGRMLIDEDSGHIMLLCTPSSTSPSSKPSQSDKWVQTSDGFGIVADDRLQVRNGFAELVKIASVGDKAVWDLLVKHGKELVETGFGFREGGEGVRAPGQEICHKGIDTMLQVSG